MSSISVIIPAYNAEKFIGEAIESALNQTRPAIEVIVVDDASTDRTAERAGRFGNAVTCVRLDKNKGPGHARNVGVMASRGEIIAMLDADDCYASGHLAEVGGLLDRHPEAGMAISSLCFASEHGEPTGKTWSINGIANKSGSMDLAEAAFRGLFLVSGNHAFRRTSLAAIEGYDEMVEYVSGRRVQAEDNDVFLRLAVRFPCVASASPTVRYRQHGDQSSSAAPAHQRLALMKYRCRLYRRVASGSLATISSERALDRLILGWEQALLAYWESGFYSALRVHVAHGLREPLLRRATFPYLAKCLLPDAALKRIHHSRPAPELW